MRKHLTTIALAFGLLFGIGTLSGCEKNQEAAPGKTAATATQQAVAQAPESDVVSAQQLDEILQGLPEFMADNEHVFVRSAAGGFRVALNTDVRMAPPAEERVICSSREVTWSFANCVKNHVLANGCGMLQHGANGWTLSNCPN